MIEKSRVVPHARKVLHALILILVLVLPGTSLPWPVVEDAVSASIRVPILVYHTVDESGNIYSVTPAQLDAHCRWLVAHGYTALTVRQFWKAVRGRAALPPNPVILTNDDGSPSAIAFARILARHGLVATYFVNNVSPLTEQQIRWLSRRGEVEAHAVSHVALSGLAYSRQLTEIADNITYLEQITGSPVRFLAWPYGFSDESAARAAAQAGIVAAFGVSGVPASLDVGDRYDLPRITIQVDDDLADFAAKVQGS